MSLVFFAGLNSNDWSEWTSKSNSNAAYEIQASAALGGTAYGIKAPSGLIPDSFSNIRKSILPSGNNYRMAIRFNINTYDPTIATDTDLFAWVSNGVEIARIYLDTNGSVWKATALLKDDGFTERTVADPSTLPSGDITLEIRMQKASTALSNDGELGLFVNGILVASRADVDVFNGWSAIANEAVTGVTFSLFGGAFYIDEYYFRDDDAPIFSSVSGGYVIGQAIDQEQDGRTLYATIWRNNTLYLQRWSVSGSPFKLAEVSLGAATFSEVSTKTTIAWPYAGSDSDVWVFGRMSSPVGAPTSGVRHILSSTVGGTGTWSDVAGITGTWAINDVMDSLHITPPVNDAGLREFAAVRRRSISPPELWTGNNALALSAVIPFPSGTGAEYKGMHKSGAGGEISVGSAAGGIAAAANRIFSTVPPYTATRDISFDYPSGTVEVLRYF